MLAAYAVLSDPELRRVAEYLILKSGIKSKYKGAGLIADATLVYAADDIRSIGEIYAAVAQFRNKKAKTVFRAIAYAIENSVGLDKRIAELTGIHLAESEMKPKNVIFGLGECLKYEFLLRQLRVNNAL